MNRTLTHIALSIAMMLVLLPSSAQGTMKILKGKKEKITFEFINNLIIIPVTLNGKKLSFILDTGARNTILFGASSTDSLVLNDKVKTKIRGLGDGHSVDAIISKNNRIKLQDVYGYGQTVYVILEDKFDLSLRMGKPVHGIIGYNLLKDFVVSINFNTKKITFNSIEHYKPPTSEKYKKFDLEFHRSKPYINAESQLNNSTIHQTKLLLDTGCSHALWLFENDKTALTISGNYFIDYLGEGINGSIIGKRGKIKSFTLGDFVFKDVHTAFLDSVSTSYARSFKGRDGSIGSRLLDRFHVILNYSDSTLYLKKAKSFKDLFKYNRAGLEVAYQKGAKVLKLAKDRTKKIKISVNDVGTYDELFEIVYQYELKRLFYIYYIRPNSPAEKAGLRVGDFIQKINGKPAYDYKLDEIINIFYGNKGELVKIIVERNGGPHYYEFKLEEPL